jgi:hypothetical protein
MPNSESGKCELASTLPAEDERLLGGPAHALVGDADAASSTTI